MNKDHRLYFQPLVYIAPKPEGSSAAHDFIIITQGETGYRNASPFMTREQADKHHKHHNITPAQVQAAIACSMFDCWQNFDKIAAEHEAHQERTA